MKNLRPISLDVFLDTIESARLHRRKTPGAARYAIWPQVLQGGQSGAGTEGARSWRTLNRSEWPRDRASAVDQSYLVRLLTVSMSGEPPSMRVPVLLLIRVAYNFHRVSPG